LLDGTNSQHNSCGNKRSVTITLASTCAVNHVVGNNWHYITFMKMHQSKSFFLIYCTTVILFQFSVLLELVLELVIDERGSFSAIDAHIFPCLVQTVLEDVD